MGTVTGLTAARMLEIEANSVVNGSVDADGNLILTKHDGTSFNAGNIYDVLGFVYIVQANPPTPEQIAAADGRPIVWITDSSPLTPVPATPTAPSFNYTTFAVTVPSVVGVEYQFYDPTVGGGTWTPLAAGTTSLSAFTRPFTAKVRAVAKAQYVLTATYLWEALFYDEASLTLYSSDGFAGTSGDVLAPAGGGIGRAFDKGPGGTNNMNWYAYHNSGVGDLMILPSGTAASKNTGGTSVDPSHGEAAFNVGADNCLIEVSIIAPFTPAHSRGFTITVGGTARTGTNCVTAALYINSTTAEIRCTGQTFVYKTNVTEANLLGTWKFAWVNKGLKITCPDGQIFSKDYSTDGITHGQWASIGVNDYNGTGKQFPTYDLVKVYR